jgi:hypothetical protein
VVANAKSEWFVAKTDITTACPGDTVVGVIVRLDKVICSTGGFSFAFLVAK